MNDVKAADSFIFKRTGHKVRNRSVLAAMTNKQSHKDGTISDHEINSHLKEDLIKIQNLLFNLGSLLANDKDENLKYLPKITKTHIDFLEKRIDEIEDELSELKNFILPSGNKIFSLTQIARTVCRRSERKLVKLSNDQKNIDLNYVSFLNRLSDYLFVLSRKFLKDFNVQERYWQKDY